METKGIQRTFVVSFDHAQGDKPVMCIGETNEKYPGVMNVVAIHEGDTAIDIYKSLIGDDKNAHNV